MAQMMDHEGGWQPARQRESFLLDGGAPFYRCYGTSDGKYMAVGAIEAAVLRGVAGQVALSTDDRLSSMWSATRRCMTSSPSDLPAEPATSGRGFRRH